MADRNLELAQDFCAGTHFFDPSCEIEDIKRFYNQHADQYDKEIFALYPGASTALQTFLEVLGEGYQNMNVLDVGAGTGVVGAHLMKQGFTNVDGLDLSENMLEKAKERNLYENYIVANITDKPLDIPSGTYDAIISCGAITSGMIKPGALEEMCRLTRAGGYICFTIRIDCYEDDEKYGYRTKVQELVDKGKWQEMRHFLTQYVEGPKMEFQKKCYIFCFKVLNN